jgi:hypothetical protein
VRGGNGVLGRRVGERVSEESPVLTPLERQWLEIVRSRLDRDGIVGVPYFLGGDLFIRIHSVDEQSFPLLSEEST